MRKDRWDAARLRDRPPGSSSVTAEFDTRTPHWFGRVGPGDVEFLSLFGRQGERIHVRAAPPGRLGGAAASES
ncbi:hypothetical protein [Compostimonas suwonensis]|uniref:hypothetical protein n=1 Tax=Compostimonas suwonensis TaxID=1048394 RepID=UPI001B80060B|nr:hypothetical protein [Compostimonas suwonensis]